MPVDYSAFPFADIRNLLWDELKSSEVLDENDYWSETMNAYLNPIIPSQEVPEFQNILPGMPYIVYDWEVTGYDTEFWICEETATLTVSALNYRSALSIIELIKDVFRRYDMSARLINYSNSGSKFKFLTCYIDSVVSPEFGEQEGGTTFSVISIRYKYTRGIDISYRYSS